MSQPVVELDDDNVLAYTQRKRQELLNHLMENGKYPDDTKTQQVVLTTLADMDRAALGRKRIQSSERILQADALVNRAISTIVQRYGSAVPFQTGAVGSIPDIQTQQLPEAKPVPGETDIGLSEHNYHTLVKAFD
jgi:hypothetical protein